MRRIVSNYTEACDTRVEVVTHGEVSSTHDFSASDWVRANRTFGALAADGLHVRLVSVGLEDMVISEVFGLLEGGHVPGPCPACGAVCIVSHEDKNDVTGRRIIENHWSGVHDQCHPDGCGEQDPGESRRVRTRKESE